MVLAAKFYIFYLHFRKPLIGTEGMIGLCGETLETLDPSYGQVKIRGEIWQAKAPDGVISKEEKIEVVNVLND